MKKRYEKPAMRVIQIDLQNQLLASSDIETNLIDLPDFDNWDIDGGQQFDKAVGYSVK